MKEYSCDYRVYARKIYIIRGKLKNFKATLCFCFGWFQLVEVRGFVGGDEQLRFIFNLYGVVFENTQERQHSRKTTLTILFHGASYHLTLPTTAPVKDATSA